MDPRSSPRAIPTSKRFINPGGKVLVTWRDVVVPNGGQLSFSKLSPHLTNIIELSMDK